MELGQRWAVSRVSSAVRMPSGETAVGDRPAVVPELTGSAWITGRAELSVDPDDPFPEGFTVGDLWGLPD